MEELHSTTTEETKFCSECGKQIAKKAVVCPHCGCKVEGSVQADPSPWIVINNSNQNQNVNTAPTTAGLKRCDKMVSILLCIFLGMIGGHKFYEGKIGMGVLYLFTGGLFCIGCLVDFITLLGKPGVYYV